MKHLIVRGLVCFSATLSLLTAQQALSPAESQLTKTITANSLKGHVSFLASDALEGRDTPSKGLEVAGEYIASEYRRLGLKPAVGDSYFQEAPYALVKQPMDGFELTLEGGGKSIRLDKSNAGLTATGAMELSGLELVKVNLADEAAALPPRESVEGKAIILVTGPTRTMAMYQKQQQVLRMEPKIAIVLRQSFGGAARLREKSGAAQAPSAQVTTTDAAFRAAAEALPAGATGMKISGRIPAPEETPVTLRNVIAVLPGSDPQLKDTYVLLSAHYDHVGRNERAEGDKIFNGANDDASGVATLLEIARAMSRLKEAPKRTVVFAAWFGEEKGLLGSRFYAKNPLFPIKNTVANLNFEHMGRTDDNEGAKLSKLTASGYDFSEVIDYLVKAGADTGVEAWKHEQNSDAFFARSDNQALADAGVPAHTICVAWIFPDYHRAGDHWDKIDYDNFAKVTGTLAVTVLRIADSVSAPKWNEANAKTARYVDAWKKLHSQPVHAGGATH